MKKADISVGYNKEKDGTYTKFAYSPFVMAYNDDKDIFKSLKASKIVKKSKYSDDEYNFNMLKLINTIVEGKHLKDLGFQQKLPYLYRQKIQIIGLVFMILCLLR